MRRARVGPWMGFACLVLKPLLLLVTRRRWSGFEHVPPGGVVLVSNHISYADPFTFADWVIFGLGRAPRFLVKSTLMQGKGLVGAVLRGARQIPVHRGTSEAALALDHAVAAVQAGECVCLYPEGTITRDPDIWPMVARTGAVRLALLSGAPVVPVAQWGAHRLVDSYRTGRIRLLPPAQSQVRAFPPVDLSAYRGRELTADLLRDATATVMAALTAGVAELRGESPPAGVFDPELDTRRTA